MAKTKTSWKRGQSGNPAGKNENPTVAELKKAIATVQKTKDCSLLEHLIKRCYESDAVLIAVARKLLPDLKTVEANITDDSGEGTKVIYLIEGKPQKRTGTHDT